MLVVVRKVDVGDESDVEEEEKRPANAPLVKVKGAMELQLSPEDSARRCNGNGRGIVYDPSFGISCHFCRYVTIWYCFISVLKIAVNHSPICLI